MTDLEQMLESGEINEFFYNQLAKNLHYLPEDLHEDLFDTVRMMSALGVSDVGDQKLFMLILQHAPDILSDIAERAPSYEDVGRVVSETFRNKDDYPINTLHGLFEAIAHAAKEQDIELKRPIVEKFAYPQGYAGVIPRPRYDIRRWMQATRDIYLGMQQRGLSRDEAEAEVTRDWDNTERLDFQYWLRFYEEKVPEKYPKLAQNYYESNTPGFVIPNPIGFDALKSKLPNPIRPDEKPEIKFPEPDKSKEEQTRETIETQRAKIVSRLNAAEKLLSSMDGQMFAGQDQEFMLKLLQDLKRKVQTANKITIKSSLFEDFIYREANKLKDSGFNNAASFFYKIAQSMDLLGAPPEAPMPEGGDDLLGGGMLPGEGGMGDMGLGGPEEGADAVSETKEAMNEFFDNLRTGISGLGKDHKKEKEKKEKEKKASFDDADIVVEAQAEPIGTAVHPGPPPPRSRVPIGPAPETMPVQEAPPPEPPPEPPMPEDVEVEGESPPDGEDAEGVIEAALGNITINDVITELEAVVSFFKRREISRKLSLIDIMMDKLGIGSFFPSLGEAQGKSLESNQYISTRVEEVLTKLKGTVETERTEALLDKSPPAAPPETAGLRESLEGQEKAEEERKALRKQRELDKLKGKAAPGPVAPAGPPPAPAEELAAPAPVEAPPRPIPTR
jgi:hypothetical protein